LTAIRDPRCSGSLDRDASDARTFFLRQANVLFGLCCFALDSGFVVTAKDEGAASAVLMKLAVVPGPSPPERIAIDLLRFLDEHHGPVPRVGHLGSAATVDRRPGAPGILKNDAWWTASRG